MFPRGLYQVSDGVAHREPDVKQQHLHEVEPGQGVEQLLHLVLGLGGRYLTLLKRKILNNKDCALVKLLLNIIEQLYFC